MKRVRITNKPAIENLETLNDDKYLPSQSVFIDYKDTPSYKSGKDSIYAYSNEVLIGPWFEESQDVKNLCRGGRLLSPYNCHFRTTYDVNYNTHPLHKIPEALWGFSNHPSCRKNRVYPAHQPEVDPSIRCFCPWQTTYCTNFKKHPIVCKECPKECPDKQD